MAGKPLLRMFSITIFVVFYSENSCFLFFVPLPITVARFPLPLTFIINDDASSEENRGLDLVDQDTQCVLFSLRICAFCRCKHERQNTVFNGQEKCYHLTGFHKIHPKYIDV